MQRGFRIALACIAMAVAGCKNLTSPPNDAEALVAVRTMLDSTGIHLAPGFAVSGVQVHRCEYQDSPAGHVCELTLLSAEIPVLGILQLPTRMRFVRRANTWVAFLL